MNIFQQAIDRIHIANNIKAVTANSQEYPELMFDKTSGAFGKTSPKNTTEYMELYGALAPIYRAVNVKAKSIAMLPIQILKQTGDDEFEDVTKTREEYKIFTKPNPWQTKYDFWEQTIGYLQLTGESPWLLDRQAFGRPVTAMFPTRPDLIRIVPDSRDLVSHYIYTMPDGTQIRIDPEYMQFLRFFNPLEPLRGMSPISAAENEVILDINAVNASKKTFESGAQASGLISTAEHISPTEGTKVKKHIEDNYTGTKNFGKIMFLTHGFKYQQMQMNNRDMQYMEQREWNKETIAQVFGVPPILQMRFKDSSVLANTDIQYQLFWDNLKSEIVKLEETITEYLLPEITDEKDVKFHFDLSKVAALNPDLDEKGKRYKEMFAMGAVSPNEIRQDILGKDPVDNPAMDLFYVPFSLTAIEDIGMDESAEESVTENFIKDIDLLYRRKQIESNGGGTIGDIKTTIKEIEAHNENVENRVYIQKSINDLNKINAKGIKSFKIVLAKLFKEQEKEVIANLYRSKFHKFSTDGVSFDYKKWVKKFKDAGYGELATALELAASDLAKEFGGTYNVADPNASKFIGKKSLTYAEQVNTTSKNKIDKILKGAVQNNLSIEETATKLTEFFNSSQTMRSLRIARTEIVGATNNGRQIAAMQTKKIEFKEWVTQRDGLVRDEHVGMDGETVKKDSSFSNGSMVPDDINERCYVIYRKAKG